MVQGTEKDTAPARLMCALRTSSFLRTYGLRESFMATLGRLDEC
jgi:hypothetical protein